MAASVYLPVRTIATAAGTVVSADTIANVLPSHTGAPKWVANLPAPLRHAPERKPTIHLKRSVVGAGAEAAGSAILGAAGLRPRRARVARCDRLMRRTLS
jgi:hypothetical protein